ncbi:dihydrofolate reductase family protein [Yinghuangia soli]|uniref:Dihydrofolate reductase family protein n=1 Tax=Yinghuangia soli TaxID=2908204 RepID=A0AA41Q427_9ACTN|nr:dihydrofolate reductase family protein [Yinghuangia soli]MCF2530331.1 dihydrofolate reductase family protein [Yinghuangia soli]
MRKIVNSTYISLDGDIEKLDQWSFDYWSDDLERFATKQLFAADTLLMGRETYENFASAWSGRAGADEFADRMNAIDKVVISDTLTGGDWGPTTVVSRAGVAAAITALKGQPGGDILMYGFGPVAKTLLAHDLLDEVRFWVHPVIAGSSSSLAADGFMHRLKLVRTDAMDTGVVVLSYTPGGAPAAS